MKIIALSTIILLIGGCNSLSQEKESTYSVFQHGVASGDPLADRVIIWSRVTTPDSIDAVEVDWEIATDSIFINQIKYGKYTTTTEQDYTVKIDVTGLSPGTRYFYRFKSMGDTSVTGSTKTAAMYADSLTFAIVSCSNYETGYFNAYGRIADRKNLDAVLHLGDYIYEYGVRASVDSAIGRFHDPPTEILSVEDYRRRYAQYRTDEDLMAAHANHPFIVIWDDHEIANNSYVSGAQNHQEDEGPYELRKAVARQVYYEWMPIRKGEKLYRKFSYGQLADVFMLDERLEGRSEQVESIQDPDYDSPERSMLGKDQLDWMKSNLSRSVATWKIIGNQVIYTDLDRSLVFPDRPRNMDSWDGYPVEKREIATAIIENNIENIIWVTGDTHSSWAFETMVTGVSDAPVAVEFGTTSINSTNYDEGTTVDTVRMAQELYMKGNPHLKYTNLADHGYILLTLNPSYAKAEYFFVDTVKEPTSVETPGFRVSVRSGDPKLIPLD